MVAAFAQILFLKEFDSPVNLCVSRFQVLDQLLGFSGTDSADETQENLHVVVVDDQVQINSHIIHTLNVDFFKSVC